MIYRLFIFLGLNVLVLAFSFGQKAERHWSIASEGHLLLLGEFNTTYNFMGGMYGQYTFSPGRCFSPFLKAGVTTDVLKSNANLLGGEAQMGVRFQPFGRWFTQVGVGAMYWEESLGQQFIAQEVFWEDTGLSWVSELQVGYQISPSFGCYVLAKQYSSDTLSLGLGIQFSL